MRIKSVHKKGSKMLMKNKRGLFITNIVSKVLERVLKERNRENFTKGLSPNQTGGRRSTIDNLFTVLAIIERNNYLNKTTYLTFADVRKCFDRLWLDDGIKRPLAMWSRTKRCYHDTQHEQNCSYYCGHISGNNQCK